METPGKVSWVPVVKFEVMMVGAWMRSGCHGFSPLLLGLRERRARALEMKRTRARLRGEEEGYSGSGTEKKER